MQHFHVLTGAMGSGKSTIVAELRRLGSSCVDEPAREILAEQRSYCGTGVPEADATLFTELMLSRCVFAHRRMQDDAGPLFFDRGVPDMIAYAILLGVDAAAARNAAQVYRYNTRVFVTPDWPEIYSTDDERKMTYEEARGFGEIVRGVYEDLGYELVALPRGTPEARSQFILSQTQPDTDRS